MRVCEKSDVSSFFKKSFISILSISGSRAYLALNEKKLPSSQMTEKFVSPGKPSVVAFTRITFSAPSALPAMMWLLYQIDIADGGGEDDMHRLGKVTSTP